MSKPSPLGVEDSGQDAVVIDGDRGARAIPTRDLIVGTTVLFAAGLAMLVPMFGPLEQDSFPLSTFPMFARHRGQPFMHQLVGIDSEGHAQRLTPELLGTSEVLQAKVLIDRAAGSRKRRVRLCNQVADRVARSTDYVNIEQLELRRVRFDPIQYFVVGPTPIESRRLHGCRVERAPQTDTAR